MVQWVKDLVLSLLSLSLLLRLTFISWPGNFHMPWARLEKKKMWHEEEVGMEEAAPGEHETGQGSKCKGQGRGRGKRPDRAHPPALSF